MRRILIIGGYGVFGERIAGLLARDPGLEVVIAGRRIARARALSESMGRRQPGRLSAAAIDARTVTAHDLSALAPAAVINASGPFQSQDYRLAEACIEAGCHYIDLADARSFVAGIGRLNERALGANVSIISGASSVPALSSAVVRHLERQFARLDSIEIAISPGSGFEPGEATIAAGLSYLGKPIAALFDGKLATVFGWQGLEKRRFGPLGKRWTAYCDVPDLDLFPAHYPGLKTISFRAGLEVGLMTLGLWALSWPARLGWPHRPANFAGPLGALRKPFSFLGHNRGGMRVAVEGLDGASQPITVEWALAASDGDGLYVPTLASVILARKLASGSALPRGAMPCFGLVALDEFEREFRQLRIATSEQRHTSPIRALR